MRSRLPSAVLIVWAVFGLSACHNPPPVFTSQVDAAFVVGGQISTDQSYDDGDFFTSVPVNVWWAVTDDDANCRIRQELISYDYYGPETTFDEDYRGTSYATTANNYDSDFGGGSYAWRFIVNAHDCSGHETRSDQFLGGTGLEVWQENGDRNGPYGEGADYFTYTGTWRNQVGAWASGGQQRYTTAAGASVSFRYTYEEFDQGDNRHFGLVMAKGPQRGSADVYVDNVKIATVNTYATANDNRRIMFQRKMTAGSHTVKVVNKATAGHPRIDVDAFLVQ